MKEKGIKAEDVKNLPPIEEIHGLDNPTQVVKVNSLYRYDKVEIPLPYPIIDLSMGYRQIKSEPTIFVMLSYSWFFLEHTPLYSLV